MIRTKDDKKINSLLIKQYDPKTFDLLTKIVESYPNEKNAFQAYFKEHGQYIKKVSGSTKNAPNVVSLKYVEDKVNVSLDLSKHYKGNNDKIPVSYFLHIE